ncbi:hypothetical protein ACFQ1S_10255 [Kibdelosporangium lantanae]|uniref:Uncharacterized protein n=1 Tax=Kibdelosporangium lantanae TaxID=1497396 RepID=A0ABW3M5J8_9PSEU
MADSDDIERAVQDWIASVAERGTTPPTRHVANPALPAPHEATAERIVTLVAIDNRDYPTMTEDQRTQRHDQHYLDQVLQSGEQPEEHLRAVTELRAIGHQLNEAGGISLMIAVAERANALAKTRILRRIEHIWDGIGDWRG